MKALLPVLDAAFEGLPVAILYTDPARVVVAMNAAAEQLLGWTRAELVGRTTDVLYAAQADYDATGRERFAPSASADETRFEALLRHRSGSTFWGAIHARILRSATGEPAGIVGTVLDVTEQRRWTARRELLARMSELSTSLDPQIRIATAARIALPDFAEGAIVYLAEPDGEVTLAAVEHVDPAQIPIIRASFAEGGLPRDAPHGYRRVLREGVTELVTRVDDSFIDRVSRDEAHRAILRASALRSAVTVPLAVDGPPIGAMMLWRTRDDPFTSDDALLAEELGDRVAVALEHARLYRSEREARAAAESAARAKDEFLAVVSHELRTPLNAILGWARLLAGGALDGERAARAVATIERNAVAQAKLVEDLIDVSRIIAGKLELVVGAVDVEVLALDVVDALRPGADARAVELAVTVHRPGTVSGDAQRLRQVLVNLLSNAIKFSDAGRVDVTIGGDEDAVVVEVADAGAGIDPALLPHVFDRFWQADSSSSRRHGGLGIGLAVARTLVEKHGGTIEAASEGAGRGARFAVRLPRRIDVVPTSDTRPPASTAVLAGVRVLVVDDDADARELASWILTEQQAVVDVAADAASADRSLAERPCDVLVCDVAMPREDGHAFIRRLRARSSARHLPAVAVSAYASAEDRARSLAAGFEAHLPKPVAADALVTTVARLARAHGDHTVDRANDRGTGSLDD